ncbi:MAG: hypothetical protein HY231_19365 [Acidobacteria bacterium]|nr:hypothetical protein [Acidobacteriota bacterium]
MTRVVVFMLVLLTTAASLTNARSGNPATPKANDQQPVQASPASAGDDEYTCSMHPEIRSKTQGKCPKCGMALVAVNPAVVDDFGLQMEATPPAPKPNEKVKFRFVIINPKTSAPNQQFALSHEKYFHLFIVSQDLTQFQHIHPALNSDGSFTIETVLPHAGHYKIYCDFYPVEGSPQVLQQNISTYGYRADLFAARPKIKPDSVFIKTVEGEKIQAENAENLGVNRAAVNAKPVNGLKVELQIEPQEIIAGRPATLKYHLTDAKTGAPIKDLSPYLGAFGHTLILSEDQIEYVHSHPTELPPDSFDPEITDESKFLGGPEVTFEALFPRPGNYKIWTQFLRGNTLTTVTFQVRADRLK